MLKLQINKLKHFVIPVQTKKFASHIILHSTLFDNFQNLAYPCHIIFVNDGRANEGWSLSSSKIFLSFGNGKALFTSSQKENLFIVKLTPYILVTQIQPYQDLDMFDLYLEFGSS